MRTAWLKLRRAVHIAGDDIVTQADGPVPPSANSALHMLYRAWRDRMTGGRLPSRADMEADAFVMREPGAAMIEVEHVGKRRRYRFRAVGTAHRAAMGRDVVGYAIEDMAPNRVLPMILATYDRIVTDRKAHYWTRTLGLSTGSAHTYERLLVPLADNGRDVDTLLGVWVWRDEIPPSHRQDPIIQRYSV